MRSVVCTAPYKEGDCTGMLYKRFKDSKWKDGVVRCAGPIGGGFEKCEYMRFVEMKQKK